MAASALDAGTSAAAELERRYEHLIYKPPSRNYYQLYWPTRGSQHRVTMVSFGKAGGAEAAKRQALQILEFLANGGGKDEALAFKGTLS